MIALRYLILVVVVVMVSGLLSNPPAAADEPTATVTGTVALKGVPLSKGTIVFHLDRDSFIGARIKDGRFAIGTTPAPSSCKVTVEGDGVPAKYRAESTTPLQAGFRKGVVAHVFEVHVD